MKFRDIFNILKENEIDIFEYSSVNGVFECSLEVKKKLKKILEIPAFINYKKDIKESFLLNDFTRYNLNEDQNKIGYRSIGEVIKLSEIYLRNFENLYPKLDEYSISIKLPNNNNIGQMGKVYSDLDKILNQVLSFPEINSNIKISNFDNGSFWLDIKLGSLAAVTLVSCLTYSASYIYMEKMKYKLIEIEYEKAEIQKEHLKNLVDANKSLLDLYIKKEAKNLIENNYSDSKEDPEIMERVIFSIEKLSELIKEGTEIHPALEVSNEIKNEFPDLRYLENLTSKVKEIESK